jgi:hypothetical protein
VANHTNEPRTKTILIDMAQAWIKLAGQARRNQRIHLVYVAPTPSDLPASR